MRLVVASLNAFMFLFSASFVFNDVSAVSATSCQAHRKARYFQPGNRLRLVLPLAIIEFRSPVIHAFTQLGWMTTFYHTADGLPRAVQRTRELTFQRCPNQLVHRRAGAECNSLIAG
jgi:hypothetical protein